MRDGLALEPLLHGGGQEMKRRAGTENVAAIAGFAAAVKAAEEPGGIAALRDRLEIELKAAAPGVTIFAEAAPRLPNTTCFALPGLEAEMALMAFDLAGVAVSSGSACSSGKMSRSHVLEAMGQTPDLVAGAVRVSLGWNSTGATWSASPPPGHKSWRDLKNRAAA
jgi:cysteine desulfurase